VVNNFFFLGRKKNLNRKKNQEKGLTKWAGLRTLWLSAFKGSDLFSFFKKKEKSYVTKKERKK
jgi:hypothetical protein